MFKSFDGFMTCLLSGAILTTLFGELNKALIFLFVMMVLDLVTGIMCGAYTHTVSSSICIKGLMKKFMVLVYIIIAHFTDYLLDVDYVKTGVCYMYGVGEVISIIENGVILGVPIPKPILKALEIIHGGDDDENIR